jgi:hypothetical protein
MKRFHQCLLGVVAVSLPAVAFAQSPARSDAAYCSALSETYARYIGHDEDNSHRLMSLRGSLDAQVAVAQCKQGNTAAAIPVLERELLNQKFTLPARG